MAIPTTLRASNTPGKTKLAGAVAGDCLIFDVTQLSTVTLQIDTVETWPTGMILDAQISANGGASFFDFPDGVKEYTAAGLPASLAVRTATHLRVRVRVAGTAVQIFVSVRGVE